MKDNCLNCGQSIYGQSVQMNRGIYCMQCWRIGAVLQEMELKNQELRDKINR